MERRDFIKKAGFTAAALVTAIPAVANVVGETRAVIPPDTKIVPPVELSLRKKVGSALFELLNDLPETSPGQGAELTVHDAQYLRFGDGIVFQNDVLCRIVEQNLITNTIRVVPYKPNECIGPLKKRDVFVHFLNYYSEIPYRIQRPLPPAPFFQQEN